MMGDTEDTGVGSVVDLQQEMPPVAATSSSENSTSIPQDHSHYQTKADNPYVTIANLEKKLKKRDEEILTLKKQNQISARLIAFYRWDLHLLFL